MDILLGIYGNCSSFNPIVTDEQFSLFKERWANRYPNMIVMPHNGKGDLCYKKINYFIQTQPINDDDYYWCMCDEFDHEDYPVYVEKGKDVTTIIKEYNGKSMQRVIEVYNFSLDIDMQLHQGRAYNL